jgi:hypothetical protein
MKRAIEVLLDFLIYSVCVIMVMGGVQVLLGTKLNIELLSVFCVTVPLVYFVRDVRSSPVMIINLGESKDDNK